MSISLTPVATWASLFAGLPIACCFIVAYSANKDQINWLLDVWLIAVVFQAAFGLMQLSSFTGFYFGLTSSEIIGGFASKNTYSNFLVMALPILIWKIWIQNGSQKHRLGWGFAFFLLLVTLVLAQSRTGIFTGCLVTTLAALLLPKKSASRFLGVSWAFWILLSIVALALFTGGLDWLERFDGDRLLSDSNVRSTMRDATWDGILKFWPVGAGLGSFPTVFPMFQPSELGGFRVDLAHSDYLQLLMELGIVGLLFLILLFTLICVRVIYLIRYWKIRRQGGDILAAASLLSLVAFFLHALVDYPMRIPSNSMFAAFLAGILLRHQPHQSR
jgi:O-antigen ligase